MSSQDLMNSSSFTLQDPVEKIITDNISKVSTTNCMHTEGTLDSTVSQHLVFASEIAVKQRFFLKKSIASIEFY